MSFKKCCNKNFLKYIHIHLNFMLIFVYYYVDVLKLGNYINCHFIIDVKAIEFVNKLMILSYLLFNCLALFQFM